MRQPDWISDCGRYRLYNADCRDVLPLLEPVDTVITDPPYDLTANKKGGSGPASASSKTPAGRARITTGFMGKSWDGTGVAFDPATWVKVLESLKPGGMLLSFGGTRTYHRMACAIEDAGFEIRDCMMFLFGTGFPKSLDISKSIDRVAGAEREDKFEGAFDRRCGPTGNKKCDKCGKWLVSGTPCQCPRPQDEPVTDAARLWSGYGTALKPAYEPIVLAMKPLDGTFAENAQRHGVAGLNIDGGRIPANGDSLGGGRVSTKTEGWDRPWKHDKKAIAACIQRGQEAVAKAESLGRWPANVILDEAAGAMLDEQTGPQQSGGTPAKRFAAKTKHAYGEFNGQENPDGIGRTAGYVSRFFYCTKASASDRRGSKHPTVKPLALIEYLCRLTMMPAGGGTVLDPFMGSGTTIEACIMLDRPCIGIEQDKEHGYFADCVARAKAAIQARKSRLFSK
jgi:DNA modification methylase